MSLPNTNTKWPPPHLDPAITTATEGALWWEGDPNKLRGHYRNTSSQTRPSQQASGIVGALSRLWWGKPTTPKAQAEKRHLPLAGDICATAANTLAGNPPTFRLPADLDDASGVLQDRIDLVLNSDDHASRMLVAAEQSAATGGIYARVVWDDNLKPHPWIDYTDTTRAVPEWSWGILTAVTFWTDVMIDGNTVWRHLERYEAGVILHGLYAGTRDELGTQISLDLHESTINLPDNGVVPTGVDQLAAAYIPNRLPNPSWHTNPNLYALGRPDLTPVVIGLCDDADKAYTSLMRDIDLGRGRLIVPDWMLDTHGPGQGSSFDEGNDLFTPVSAASPDSERLPMTVHQFSIRVAEHQQVILGIVQDTLRAVGLSPITFGLDATSSATATEIRAKSKHTNDTRQARIRHWNQALSPLGQACMNIDAALFNGGVVVDQPLDVDWPDAVKETILDLAQTAQAMETARAASIEVKVRTLHPDWDDQEVDAEVKRIVAEQGMMMPDPEQSMPFG